MDSKIHPNALYDIVLRRLAWAQLYLSTSAMLPEDAGELPGLDETQAAEKATFNLFIESAPADIVEFIKKARVLERLAAEVRIRVRAVDFLEPSNDEQKQRALRTIEGRVRALEYAWSDTVCITVHEPTSEGIDIDIAIVGLYAAPSKPRVAAHPDMM